MNDQSVELSSQESLDDLILGDLKIIQPRSGYRFSIDSVLLAHFPEMSGNLQVFDLGTGNGVIALLMACRNPQAQITGLEIQEQMVERAQRSIQYNRLEKQVNIVTADINDIPHAFSAAQADLVVSNPPFWKRGHGKTSINREQAIARHELQVTLTAIIRAAYYLLKPAGSLALILPAYRFYETLSELTRQGFGLTRLRLIHPTAQREAGHFLVEAARDIKGQLKILPPLTIYQAPGVYAQELQQLYGRPVGEVKI